MVNNTKAGTTSSPVVDGTIDDTEIPAWATADPLDQQVAVHDDHFRAQYRRNLTGEELLRYVASQVTSYEDDDPRMALEIASQVAAARNLDEVLSGSDTTKGKEILDTIIEVDAIKFAMSTEAKGCPYFALISARNTLNNERHVISVGGWRLVLQLGQIHFLNSMLPPGSPYLVAPDAVGAIAPESYPVYFRIRSKATGNEGHKVNYLARTID